MEERLEGGGGRWSEEAIEAVVELPRKSLHAYKYVGVKRSSETAPTRRVSRWSAVVMAAAAVAQGGGSAEWHRRRRTRSFHSPPRSPREGCWRVRWPQRRWACLPRVGGAVLERRGGVVG